MKVLIIEDDEGNRSCLKYIVCQLFGHECETASTTQEAYEVVSWYRPEAVIIDWMMREGCPAGIIETLRNTHDPVPKILIVSGWPKVDHIASQLKVSFLYKPYSISDLETFLERGV